MRTSSKGDKKKRAYTRPSIRSSEAFERLALACNGTPGSGDYKGPNVPPPLRNCTSVGSS